MEKELYYKLSDNADMSCICNSLRQVSVLIDSDLGDIEPSERGNVFYTITPVYLTKEELEEFGDAQF